jgi:hypothetical protein
MKSKMKKEAKKKMKPAKDMKGKKKSPFNEHTPI